MACKQVLRFQVLELPNPVDSPVDRPVGRNPAKRDNIGKNSVSCRPVSRKDENASLKSSRQDAEQLEPMIIEPQFAKTYAASGKMS